MENYSYIFFVTMFVFQIIAIGIKIEKLGKKETKTHTGSDLVIIMIVTALWVLELYWFPK